MNISNIGQAISSETTQSGKDIPPRTINRMASSTDDTRSSSRAVDMSNVSLNEINSLIRSGVDGLLDMVPFISPNVINQFGGEYAAGIKVNFLGQIEDAIEYNNSMGKETAFLQKVLDNIKHIDGTILPYKVNVFA